MFYFRICFRMFPELPGLERPHDDTWREGRGSPGAAADTVTIISLNTHKAENEERQWPRLEKSFQRTGHRTASHVLPQWPTTPRWWLLGRGAVTPSCSLIA